MALALCSRSGAALLVTIWAGTTLAFGIGIPVDPDPQPDSLPEKSHEGLGNQPAGPEDIHEDSAESVFRSPFPENRFQVQFVQLVRLKDTLPDAWRERLLIVAQKPVTWTDPSTGDFHVFLQPAWENVLDEQRNQFSSKGALLERAEVIRPGSGSDWDRIELQLVDLQSRAEAVNLANHLLRRAKVLTEILEEIAPHTNAGSPFDDEIATSLHEIVLRNIVYAYVKSDIVVNADRIVRGPEWKFSIEHGSFNFNSGNLALSPDTVGAIRDDLMQTRDLFLYLVRNRGLVPDIDLHDPLRSATPDRANSPRSKTLFKDIPWLPNVTIQSEIHEPPPRRTESAKRLQ